MAAFKNFCKGAYTLADRKLAHQECINLYPEVNQDTWTLQPTGGYEDYIDLDTTGYIRAMYRTSRGLGLTDRNPLGDIIVVCGASIIWVKSDLSYEVLGLISDVLNQIDIVDDGFGICIVDGAQMYRIDMNTLDFNVVSFAELKPTKLAVLNFRTICVGEDPDDALVSVNNRFYYSDQDDNSTWDASGYYEFSEVREQIVNITTANSQLYLWGTNTYQVWQSNTNLEKPFIHRTVGAEDVGVYAADSITSLAGYQFFLGYVAQGSPSMYMVNGATSTKISTEAIDKDLANEVTSDCISYAYTELGHSFISFNFDGIDKTYVYDLLTSEWHTRAYRGDDGILHRWQPQYVISYSGFTLMGSVNESKIYKYSNEIYTQSDSGEILRRRTTPNLRSEGRNIFYDRLVIDALVGSGITGTFNAPTLMLRYSQDGGYSWSSRLDRSLGRLGNYRREVEFRRLGKSSNFVVEISISDAANCAIHNASIFNIVSQQRG